MVETTFILQLCYGINSIVLGVLAIYFLREYMNKKLKASLAWALGFAFFLLTVVNLGFLTTGVIGKPQVAFGAFVAPLMLAFFYYGASLLFFGEGSFFREKMTIILFIVVFGLSEFLVIYLPADQIADRMKAPTMIFFVFVFSVIAILFYQVSRRLPKEDPRRGSVALVSAGWLTVTFWMGYVGFYWGENPVLEAAVFLLGSFGFVLLFIGMTRGRATRR